MRVLIYGAGAVGCYLGGHLALAGHEVTLLGRASLVQAVSSNGLTLQCADGPLVIRNLHAVDTLSQALSEHGPYDWIAFTMKSYDTLTAIQELMAHLAEPPPVVSFQNGVGNEEMLRSAFGAERVVAGALTTPVAVLTPGTVTELRRRGIAIASDSPAAGVVEAALRQTSLALQVVRSSEALKWSKLLLNMVGNAVPAILDMPPADVFGDPRLFAIERAALLEALWIMDLKHIRVINLPGVPVKALTTLARWAPHGLLRLILRQQVKRGRGEKLPSLLTALRAGLRRTEVAWLNGAVVQAADSLGRLAPVNHALALTVSDITAGRVPWETYRRNPDMLLTAIHMVQGMSSS